MAPRSSLQRRPGPIPAPPTAGQYRFRRAVVLAAVLSLVAIIAGCLGRSGPAAAPKLLTTTLTASAPPPLRVVASGAGLARWLVYTSGPLRSGPARALCGSDTVSLVAPTQVAVSETGAACRAPLELTAQNGQRLSVPVTIPALAAAAQARPVPAAPLYCFASPAGRAIYITIDDGWTPSDEVLDLMHQAYLPITAFLIANAAKENLSYWNAFVAAGGLIGDHTVSHPYLTKLTQSKATTQWKQARNLLGQWLGQTPAIGRPPDGAVNHKVEVAAGRAGLTALAGWSATMSGDLIQTWDGKPLVPGEIVLLHWDPGLGDQLAVLLAAIRAQRLNPAPLTLASFQGIAPQQRTLSGD